MSGLTDTPEIPRSGRVLIAEVLKGTATGISHVAVGSGVGGAYHINGVNPRMGNNLEMLGWQPPVIHNDFPVYNFGPNGQVGAFYFMDVDNTGGGSKQNDVGLSFGSNPTGRAVLKGGRFNHLFLVHVQYVAPHGLGTILCADTDSTVMPVTVPQVICYIGYVECDSGVKSIYNPARMFNSIGQSSNMTISYLADRAISGGIQHPNASDITVGQNPSLLIRARFNLGVNDTIREAAVLGNGGTEVLAWFNAGTFPITIGQGVFVNAALGF